MTTTQRPVDDQIDPVPSPGRFCYRHFSWLCQAGQGGCQRERRPTEACGDPAFPRIVCLCGSTRFRDEIHQANARLTLDGQIVISLGVFGHLDMPDEDWTTGGTDRKRMLDDLHKRKIDLADEVFVVNVGGYVGESTRGEIAYARSHGKPVRWLEPVEACRNCRTQIVLGADGWVHLDNGEVPCPGGDDGLCRAHPLWCTGRALHEGTCSR